MRDLKLGSASCVALAVLLSAICAMKGAQTPASPTPSSQTAVALTPPMGWNSYDAYGTTIDETQFKANADWFAAHLKSFGWQYVDIDMEWFVANPVPEGNSKVSQYTMDQYGRYTPSANRFPSAANESGFKPLADYVHSLGLKFGIHILRGIPKQAVDQNLPIEGSAYHAADAADTSATCPWNYDNYGVANTAAGQAYYDSILRLYASWGVDFLKVDCISSHPYKGDDIRMLSMAISKTNRPIVLSLSPGPAPVDKVDELREFAQMWRISDDIWDLWHRSQPYPQGLGDQFANAAKWAGVAEPGHWPDADMLPIGRLGPAPGWGKPRDTRLTHDEQRTMLTLWSIIRSPLTVGGDLTAADDWTISLLTNPEVIEVDQHSMDSRPVISTDALVVWSSKAESGNTQHLAIFNVSPGPQTIHYAWKDLGLRPAKYRIRDLWERKNLGAKKSLDLTLPSHACVLYSLVHK